MHAFQENPQFSFDSLPDAPPEGERWSSWDGATHGPKPRPDWVITALGAVESDLGILKTGKEADAFLLERAVPGSPADRGEVGQSVVMVAKRYRSNEHRTFHRAAAYTEGRSVKRSRDQRALKRKSTWGKVVASSEWAVSEWDALKRCWSLGLPVPYPVQIDGTEILMEWITDDDGESAPRLAQTRPERDLLTSYFDQLRDVLATMAGNGIVHGDLSAYNLLAAGERLVVIDLPQIVDLTGNTNGLDFLLRDCANVCGWFRSRGLAVDEQDLFGELMAHAF